MQRLGRVRLQPVQRLQRITQRHVRTRRVSENVLDHFPDGGALPEELIEVLSLPADARRERGRA
eukprot:9685960-Alexandrium_andersonii.AAC.1